jgi:hypothetical protein
MFTLSFTIYCIHKKYLVKFVTHQKSLTLEQCHLRIKGRTDFEKAFDNIWRVALWYKLLLNKINEKMYNFIVNMYNSIKSCIVYNDNKSDFVSSEVGIAVNSLPKQLRIIIGR